MPAPVEYASHTENPIALRMPCIGRVKYSIRTVGFGMVQVEAVELAVAHQVDAGGLLRVRTTRIASSAPCSGRAASQSGSGYRRRRWCDARRFHRAIIIHRMVNFEDTAALEFMTRPTAELSADLARAPGDILVLGVGGKMGPTLARMAKRAAPARRVIGVARFSEKGLREKLEAQGVECIACDLLDRAALERLPRAPNLVFMAGHKFGAAGNTAFTWAMNVRVPYMVADTFRTSRCVVFSTACVYPFAEVTGAGARRARRPCRRPGTTRPPASAARRPSNTAR
jgi:hypothetical protein